MSTASPRPVSPPAPPLADGQRMDRATFHARYEATPEHVRAQLIEGVVYMSCPQTHGHDRPNFLALMWVGHYEHSTPGVMAHGDATWLMDDQAEPEPDAVLRILPERGGQSRVEGKYLAGAPELVIEVSYSTKATDLGPKRRDYERADVIEYVVVTVDPDEVIWHEAGAGGLARVAPGPDGLYRSRTFPGLWLDPAALLNRDLDGLLAALDLGLATPEHAAFVARLAAGAGGPTP